MSSKKRLVEFLDDIIEIEKEKGLTVDEEGYSAEYGGMVRKTVSMLKEIKVIVENQ